MEFLLVELLAWPGLRWAASSRLPVLAIRWGSTWLWVAEDRLAEPFLELHRIAGHHISPPKAADVHGLYQVSDS
jgi:hypothetical protein